jgi:hypothetical protein
MAEGQAAQGGSRIRGWLKAGVTSLVGLASGAAIMYCTPLINSVIKPGKPVANFQSEPDGLKVVFHNLSSGGSEGWWDFGDGSALQPFVSGQSTITHTYAKPGAYSVKLSLRSLFGEENERSANVALDGATPAAGGPAIDAFDVQPLQPGNYSPATFRVVSKVKNAEMCVWSPGNEYPIEVVGDVQGSLERYVTLKQAGYHVLKLAAYGSKQTVEKYQVVQVQPQPANMVTAALSVAYDAVYVRSEDITVPVRVDFPPGAKADTYRFDQAVPPPRPGWEITAVRFPQPVQDPHFRTAPVVQVGPDRKAHITGELVKVRNAAPFWVGNVVLTVQHRSNLNRKAMPDMAMVLPAPGKVLIPMPQLDRGWVPQQRTLTLKLLDGDRALWQGAQMPQGQEIVVRGRRYRVSAAEAGSELRIELIEVPGVPLGN